MQNIYPEKSAKKHKLTSSGSTVVLVTNQFQCERLIRAGRNLCDITGSELCVLNIQSNDYPTNPEAIQYLFNISAQNNGTMQLLYSDKPYNTICKFIKENKICRVVTGVPGNKNSILHSLWSEFPNIHFFTVDNNGKLQEV